MSSQGNLMIVPKNQEKELDWKGVILDQNEFQLVQKNVEILRLRCEQKIYFLKEKKIYGFDPLRSGIELKGSEIWYNNEAIAKFKQGFFNLELAICVWIYLSPEIKHLLEYSYNLKNTLGWLDSYKSLEQEEA